MPNAADVLAGPAGGVNASSATASGSASGSSATGGFSVSKGENIFAYVIIAGLVLYIAWPYIARSFKASKE